MKRRSLFLFSAMVFGFAFLYIPIVSLIVYSFNESRLVTVWSGFSTKWYGELLRNQQLLDAAWLSIRIAAVNASLALVLGTLAALAIARRSRIGTGGLGTHEQHPARIHPGQGAATGTNRVNVHRGYGERPVGDSGFLGQWDFTVEQGDIRGRRGRCRQPVADRAYAVQTPLPGERYIRWTG